MIPSDENQHIASRSKCYTILIITLQWNKMSIGIVFLVQGTEPENQVINYHIKKLKACLLYKNTFWIFWSINKYLLGDGGVWSDIVGTPVVGVTWLGNWVPCDKLRFNWGVLLLIPLIGRPSAPNKKIQKKEIHCHREWNWYPSSGVGNLKHFKMT